MGNHRSLARNLLRIRKFDDNIVTRHSMRPSWRATIQ
jgi:hypothetical protein